MIWLIGIASFLFIAYLTACAIDVHRYGPSTLYDDCEPFRGEQR